MEYTGVVGMTLRVPCTFGVLISFLPMALSELVLLKNNEKMWEIRVYWSTPLIYNAQGRNDSIATTTGIYQELFLSAHEYYLNDAYGWTGVILSDVGHKLKEDEKCLNTLLSLGDLELKNDDWVKAKESYQAAMNVTNGTDSYVTLCKGNWNYFTAIWIENRAPKLKVTHLEKSKELSTEVLFQHNANLYAADGVGVVFGLLMLVHKIIPDVVCEMEANGNLACVASME